MTPPPAFDAADAAAGAAAELQRLREQVAERDDLLAIAAHELRNPLHALMLQLTLARSAADTGDATLAAERIQKVQGGLARYAERATLLLDLSRLNAGAYPLSPQRVDLAELLRERVDEQRAEARFRGVGLVLALPAEPLAAEIDTLAFEQVVLNLIGNAFKHAGARTLQVSLRADGPGRALLSIVDDGRGLSAADQARVFGKFATARDGRRGAGSGLGLWIVRKLVDALGGTISLDSQPGAGCAFHVALPLRRTCETR